MITDTDAVLLVFYNMIHNAASVPSLFPKYRTVSYTYETMASTKIKKFYKIYIIQHYILMRHTVK